MKDIKVLIAEFDPLIPNIHKSYIKEVGGFSIMEPPRDRSNLFQLLDHEKPDLIIFDDNQFDISSGEVISFVQAKELPIDFIMVTAVNNSTAINQALRSGVFDYILKPFHIERFKDSLRIYREFRQQLTNKHALTQADLDNYAINRR